MRRSTTVMAAGLALALGPLLAVTLLRAQTSELRSVHGNVSDKGEAPVQGAVVYLKNVRTMMVKTYISSEDGQYRFSGLDPNVDYELHAERNELTSGNRTLSSFDGRKDIVIPLKLDKEKKKGEK